jgi:anti-sigma factor RsiW
VFGQQSLFVGPGDRTAALRFRVSAAGRKHPATASLALAVARARAAAIEGHRVVIVAMDGTAAVVNRSPEGSGFVVISYGPGTWPAQCRRLLEEHG